MSKCGGSRTLVSVIIVWTIFVSTGSAQKRTTCREGKVYRLEDNKCVPNCSRFHYYNRGLQDCEPCKHTCHIGKRKCNRFCKAYLEHINSTSSGITAGKSTIDTTINATVSTTAEAIISQARLFILLGISTVTSLLVIFIALLIVIYHWRCYCHKRRHFTGKRDQIEVPGGSVHRVQNKPEVEILLEESKTHSEIQHRQYFNSSNPRKTRNMDVMSSSCHSAPDLSSLETGSLLTVEGAANLKWFTDVHLSPQIVHISNVNHYYGTKISAQDDIEADGASHSTDGEVILSANKSDEGISIGMQPSNSPVTPREVTAMVGESPKLNIVEHMDHIAEKLEGLHFYEGHGTAITGLEIFVTNIGEEEARRQIVRETGMVNEDFAVRCLAAPPKYTPCGSLRPGMGIVIRDKKGKNCHVTIGGFVENEDGQIFAMTVHHGKCETGDQCYINSTAANTAGLVEIGKVTECFTSDDKETRALVLILIEDTDAQVIVNVVNSDDKLSRLTWGDKPGAGSPVQKIGAVTGKTSGKIEYTHFSLPKKALRKVLAVSAVNDQFAQEGDSGSLVTHPAMTGCAVEAVGMLMGQVTMTQIGADKPSTYSIAFDVKKALQTAKVAYFLARDLAGVRPEDGDVTEVKKQESAIPSTLAPLHV